MLRDTLAVACVFESGHLTLVSGAGEAREVVSKKVGKEVRGAQGGVDRRSYNATSVDVEIDPHCRRLGRSQTDFALHTIESEMSQSMC